jgi:hypothetical protein
LPRWIRQRLRELLLARVRELAPDVERAARATSEEEAKLGRNLLELLQET